MIWPESGLIMAVYAGLLLFGVGYNALVAWAERRGYTEGYMSLVVATGVAITLAGVAIIDWRATILSAGAFVASGLPMIAGSIARHIKARERAQQALVENTCHDT